MEDLQMFNSFEVKSKITGTYSVSFITELKSQLINVANDGDVVFVIDEKLIILFKDDFDEIIKTQRYISIISEEKTKTIDYAQEVIRKLIALNIRKNDKLIAIGGGITQDIVAFISSILYRGLEWIFFPTTLLAQCDSCIGSKSSINFDQFKNLIGTFNPPNKIFIYNKFLNTLTESEIRSGIGEMLHYFFTDGISLAQEISDQYDELLIDRSKLPYFISNSLRIKKKTIEIDEFDTSIRHIFNYGHTFGHAIEAITDYAIPHGQAISIGMDLANFISFEREILSSRDFDLMHSILIKNIPIFKVTEENIENYCSALSRDKKNKGNKLGSILSKGPGKVEKIFIDIDEHLKIIILKYFKIYQC
jgi:3-dehydroquinate synthase